LTNLGISGIFLTTIGMEHIRKNQDTSNILKAGLLATVAGAYALDYLDEIDRQTPIWEYRSDPKLPLEWDRGLRVLGNPLMKLIAGGIISHHWDWISIPDKEEYSQRWVRPSSDKFYNIFTNHRLNPLYHALAHLSTGIQEVCVLGLDWSQIRGKKAEEIEGYHYAFQSEGQEDVRKSRIIVPGEEQIRLLISTKPLRILALDDQNRELPSVVHGPIDRNDPYFKNLRQF
jgi:hypothetical protein